MRSALIKDFYESEEYLRKLRAKASVLKECEEELSRARIIADPNYYAR